FLTSFNLLQHLQLYFLRYRFKHMHKFYISRRRKCVQFIGYLSDIQEAMGDKTFFKILNALGFKGEIKRAFFYKVDARTLCYRGDNLTIQQLKDAGINIKLLVKQLEAADAKYNPV
ncbi:MAG: hypothetical protein M1484_04455, partial [Patescibacteria group bacterium]|nr:hypothetical protein [Patescibacteria group bacterium]